MVKNLTLLGQIYEKCDKHNLQRVSVTMFRAGPDNAWRLELHWTDTGEKGNFMMRHESDDVLDLVDALDGIYEPENLANELNVIKEMELEVEQVLEEALEDIADEDLL